MKFDRELYLKTLAADEACKVACERYTSAAMRAKDAPTIHAFYAVYKSAYAAYMECLYAYGKRQYVDNDTMQEAIYYTISPDGHMNGPFSCTVSSSLDAQEIARHLRVRYTSPMCDGIYLSAIDDMMLSILAVTLTPSENRPPALLEVIPTEVYDGHD